jgi:hypothetical protein
VSIADRIASVRARIAEAAELSGRDPSEVTLVAVTKGVSASAIEEACAAGVEDLGENRVADLLAKQDAIRAPVRWHLVGTLQRNKVARIASRVELIHSVDSIRLGEAIALRAGAGGQDVLLEVNVSGEPTKRGVSPHEAHDVARALVDLTGVRLRGFMTIAPEGYPEAARACFARLRALRDEVGLPAARALSMGMSGDLEMAVAEGATIVRVGNAIFGSGVR